MPTSWSQCSLFGSESTRVRLQFCQIEGQVLGSQNASGSGLLKPPHIHGGGVCLKAEIPTVNSYASRTREAASQYVLLSPAKVWQHVGQGCSLGLPRESGKVTPKAISDSAIQDFPEVDSARDPRSRESFASFSPSKPPQIFIPGLPYLPKF